MAISQSRQTANSVSTADTICCFILWEGRKEGRKITFSLLLSGMPHHKACFPLPWLFGTLIPLSRLYPVAKLCPERVPKHVVHLMRLTAASSRLKDRNSRSLSELL